MTLIESIYSKKVLCVSLLWLGLLTFGSCLSKSARSPELESSTNINSNSGSLLLEEQSIYSYLLKNAYGLRGSKVAVVREATPMFLFRNTNIDDVVESLKKHGSSNIEPEMIEDYRKNNLTKWMFNDEIPVDDDVKLIDLNAARDYSDGWRIVRFSRIGLSSDKKKALVYYSFRESIKQGVGRFIVLSKNNGEWKTLEDFDVWS